MTEVVGRGGPGVNVSTGELLSFADLIQRAYRHRVGAAAAREVLQEVATRSGVWYQVRNGLLIGGFLLLIAARVLPPLL
jgi:hypothetical protein